MNNKFKAVILDGYTENPGDLSWDGVCELVDLTVYDRTPQEQVIERANGADIVIVNKVALTKEIIDRLPDLKFVSTLATGFNQIDGKALRERNIPATGVGKTIPQLINITEKGIKGKKLLLKNNAIIMKSAVHLLKLATYNSIRVNQSFISRRLFCTAGRVNA